MKEKISNNKKFEAGVYIGINKILLVLLMSSVLIMSGISGVAFSMVSESKEPSNVLSEGFVPYPIYGTAEYEGGGWAVGANVTAHTDESSVPPADRTVYTSVGSGGSWQVDVGAPGPSWPSGTSFTIWINGTGSYTGWQGTASGTVSGYYNDMGNIILYTNGPPNKPINPSPSDGETDVSTNPTLSVDVSDPDNDVLTVIFYDDSNQEEIGRDTDVPSGERAFCLWPDRTPYTTYTWYAVADDGEYTNQSETWEFTTGPGINDPPNTPDRPSGPQVTRLGTLYSYLTSTTDPDGHQVYYMWNWGDGTHSDWLGPYDSDELVSANHTWNAFGYYQIKVKAKDDPNGDGNLSDGDESNWSPELPIFAPRNIIHSNILQFIQNLIQRFPLLEQLLSTWSFYRILNFY